jgi:hypothetical protein
MNQPQSHRLSPSVHRLSLLALVAASAALTGCLATTPSSGGQSATAVTGAAAGSTTAGANPNLERCTETLGTVRIEENTNAGWYGAYHSKYGTGSTVPLLRLMVQQSNCFVIVERNARAMNNLNNERNLIRGDEGRAGSNMGGGQIVAADYTMTPQVMLSDRGGTKAGGFLSGLGSVGSVISTIGSNVSTNEASTMLTLVDVRSSVQITAAEGYAKNMDFGVAGRFLGADGSGAAGAFTRTPQGKVIAAAFIDSYNKMVVGLRNYKAQTVKGGLGTGGRLGVQGGSTPASKEVK